MRELEEYAGVTKDLPISVRYISDQKGKGVFAKRKIAEGECLIKEKPIVACQYSYNMDFFPACSHCLRSLETPSQLLKRLAGCQELPVLYQEGELVPSIQKVSCPHCETEGYCSEECRKTAWDEYHQLLCLGKEPSENHPIRKLVAAWREIHFPPETATIMLLARVIAMIKLHFKESVPQEKELLGPFSAFIREFENRDIKTAHKFLADKFQNKIEVLYRLTHEAFHDPKFEGLFTSDGFKSLFCLMCLNAQGIGTSSLEEYQVKIDEADPQSKEHEEVSALIESLEDDIEEVSGQFTHVEGSGLYRVHSCLNHSCEPNAMSCFPDHNSTLEVVALRDIEEGEEINLCYLDHAEELELDERKETLRSFYLFDCCCDLCKREEEAEGSKKGKKRRKTGA